MTNTRLLAAIAAVLVLLPGCGAPNPNDGDIQYIDLATLTERMNEAAETRGHLVLVDPRPPADYAAGRIPSAVNVRLPDLEQEDRRHPSLAGREWIVVYGQDPASAVAKGMAKRLIRLKYKRVRMFAGGMKAWAEAGMPVERAE